MKNDIPTISFLLIIVAAAGLLRFAGLGSPHVMTWDELYYIQMGADLSKDPLNYNCHYFAGMYERQNLKAPQYLNEPIFKHPPLFSYMLSIVFKAGKICYVTAAFVPIFFGLALIPISFSLGNFLFDKKTGLAAAFLVAVDPINWVCSEKIWMETALAAFMWLSVYFIIKAVTEKRYLFFLLAGIASGLAALTKYPAFLVFPIGVTIIALEDKKAFRSWHFWMWPLITALIFSPWAIWNYVIYGNAVAEKVINLHEIKPHIILFSIAAIAIATVLIKTLKTAKARFIFIAALLLFVFLRPYVMDGAINMFSVVHVPLVGKKLGLFHFEPWTFYFRRMIELSPFYMIAFAGMFFLAKNKSRERFLIIPALWSLIFFSAWGSYQSRYVLFAAPALLILAVRAIFWCWEKIGKKVDSGLLKTICRLCVIAIVMFALIKTAIIDMAIALSNDFVYF